MEKEVSDRKYESKYCRELARRIGVENLDECYYFPKYLAIETCNNCNARCIMCPKGQNGTKTIQVMDDLLFSKIVRELSDYTDWIEMVCLNSDGEPLLDQKIVSRIKQLKDIGIKHVFLSTNASLLPPQKIQELIDARLDDIRISLDAYEKQTFEKIRRGLDYDLIKQNTLNLIKMRDASGSKMSIRIRMVEMEENKNERDAWTDFWKSKVNNETDKVQLMPMHTWSGKIAPEEEDKIQYYSDKPCVSVFSSLAVNYDGKVPLCDSDTEQQEIMGDVNLQSVKEIWQNHKFEMIRNFHADAKRNNVGICRGCDHWSREFKESI